MALTYIGSTARARVNAASTTLGITVANAAALLVCNTLNFNAGGATCAVSDSVNGAWTQAGTASPSADAYVFQHYFPNSGTGAKTVTVDPAGAGACDIEFWVSEVTGADTSSPLDAQSGSATGTFVETSGGTATVTSASTLSQANNIVFAVATHDASNRTLTTGNIGGSAATQVGENEDNAAGQAGHVEYRIIASNAQLTSTVTLVAGGVGGTKNWAIFQGIYKEAGGGTTIAVGAGVLSVAGLAMTVVTPLVNDALLVFRKA